MTNFLFAWCGHGGASCSATMAAVGSFLIASGVLLPHPLLFTPVHPQLKNRACTSTSAKVATPSGADTGMFHHLFYHPFHRVFHQFFQARTGPQHMHSALMEVAVRLNSGQSVTTAWSRVLRQLSTRAPHAAKPETQQPPLTEESLVNHILALKNRRNATVVDSLVLTLRFCFVHGIPVADILTTVANSIDEAHQAANQRQTAVAGPRASARILMVLPLMGIALGLLLGANPLRVFTDGAWGTLAGVTGLALTVTGWVTSSRLIRIASEAGGVK